MDPNNVNSNPQNVPAATTVLIPAKRFNRWVASVLDNFFLGLATLPVIIISQIILQGKVSFEEADIDALLLNYPLVIVISLVIVGLYRIGLLVRNEATPGKKWRKLKVVQYNNGSRINILRASAREISQVIYYIPLLGTLIYFISVLMVLFSKNRRALHDLIGGTIVIQNQS